MHHHTVSGLSPPPQMEEGKIYMRMILDESRARLSAAIHCEPTVFRLLIDGVEKNHQLLRPIPTKNVSDDLSRDDFGFMGFTTRKLALNMSTSWVYPEP